MDSMMMKMAGLMVMIPTVLFQGQETDVVEGEQTIHWSICFKVNVMMRTDNNGDGEIDSLDDGCSSYGQYRRRHRRYFWN